MTIRNAESFGTYGATWEAHGYSGTACGELVDSLKGRAAVIAGNAVGVFTELERALRSLENPVVFAANDVGMYIPKLDHWVSLHADNLIIWKSVRWLHRQPTEPKLHSDSSRAFVNHAWEGLSPLFPLSGYFAMQLAHIMGCSPIVLCGCPGSPSRRFFEGEQLGDFGYGGGPTSADGNIKEQVIREMERLPAFKKKVRSTSGWTREFFGGLRGINGGLG